MATLSIVDDDVAFAEAFLYILDKQKRRIRLRFKPQQSDYLANRTRRDLILKARQMGFSTAIQARLFRRAVTSSAATMTLAHDDQTTQKLRRMAERFYNNLPEGIRPVRKLANASVATYADFDSEAMIATAGNVNTGRGSTYTDIHGSEVAFWPDAEAVLASIMQGGDPDVVLESTPNGAQGHFYNLCMEALDGNSDWMLHFYPWFNDPAYQTPLAEGELLTYSDDEAALVTSHNLTPEQIKWRRAKQRELKHLFIQEYPEDPRSCFLRSGLGYFGDLSGVFTAPGDPQPDSTHRYVAGLDFGQTTDYTALSILDATARVQVARLRINGLPWAEMRRQVIVLCKAWGVRVIQAEANSMGSTNIEAMYGEMAAAGCDASLIEFITSNETKASIMSALHEGLHAGDGLRLQDDPVQRHELIAFIAKQLPSGAWRLAAPDGEHDDTVIGLALAWDQVANYRPTGGIHVR
jgi:hypothetical protein